LKPWRGKLRQNTHQFTSVISLTEPRGIAWGTVAKGHARCVCGAELAKTIALKKLSAG
jgi:hypothetical protein